MRTVTVSDTNTIDAIKELDTSLPLVHENLIKNSVYELKLLAVTKYATGKINHYVDTSILNARKRKQNKEQLDEDIDSDDPMYDEPYQEIGPLFDSHVLNKKKRSSSFYTCSRF